MDQAGFDDQGRPVPVTGFDFDAVDHEAQQRAPEQRARHLNGVALRNSLEWLCSNPTSRIRLQRKKPH
jgi:hypothetical protein